MYPINTILGDQAALVANPGDEDSDGAFVLEAENTSANPLDDAPVFDDDECQRAVFVIDSILVPKVVYPALGWEAPASEGEDNTGEGEDNTGEGEDNTGEEEESYAPEAAPPATAFSG